MGCGSGLGRVWGDGELPLRAGGTVLGTEFPSPRPALVFFQASARYQVRDHAVPGVTLPRCYWLPSLCGARAAHSRLCHTPGGSGLQCVCQNGRTGWLASRRLAKCVQAQGRLLHRWPGRSESHTRAVVALQESALRRLSASWQAAAGGAARLAWRWAACWLGLHPEYRAAPGRRLKCRASSLA